MISTMLFMVIVTPLVLYYNGECLVIWDGVWQAPKWIACSMVVPSVICTFVGALVWGVSGLEDDHIPCEIGFWILVIGIYFLVYAIRATGGG